MSNSQKRQARRSSSMGSAPIPTALAMIAALVGCGATPLQQPMPDGSGAPGAGPKLDGGPAAGGGSVSTGGSFVGSGGAIASGGPIVRGGAFGTGGVEGLGGRIPIQGDGVGPLGGMAGFVAGGGGAMGGGGGNWTDPNCFMRCGQGNAIYYGGARAGGQVGSGGIAGIGGNAGGSGDVRLSPALVDFGTVDVGLKSAAQTVTVVNVGDATSFVATVSGAGFYLAGTSCPPTLSSTALCSVSIVFAPTAVGTASGELVVDTAQVALAGIGVGYTSGGFTATDKIDLGTVLVNEKAMAVVNIVPQPSTSGLTCAAGGGDLFQAGQTCPGSGVVSASCTFTFTFISSSAGVKSDSVVCTSGGKTTLTTVTAIVVTPASLVIQPNPAALAARVGTTTTVTLAVVNNGGSATKPLTVALVSGSASFGIVATDCVVLAALGVCKVQVGYSPTSAGAETAILAVTDATGAKLASASIDGTAVGPVDGGAAVSATANATD